mmetsp:Transcript_39826/g.86934  ORF Transcript_39826/g.86934 Transcript_39826/m.86934 type:complete len:341 (-) Transcript_39826:1261-2283(-)
MRAGQIPIPMENRRRGPSPPRDSMVRASLAGRSPIAMTWKTGRLVPRLPRERVRPAGPTPTTTAMQRTGVGDLGVSPGVEGPLAATTMRARPSTARAPETTLPRADLLGLSHVTEMQRTERMTQGASVDGVRLLVVVSRKTATQDPRAPPGARPGLSTSLAATATPRIEMPTQVSPGEGDPAGVALAGTGSQRRNPPRGIRRRARPTLGRALARGIPRRARMAPERLAGHLPRRTAAPSLTASLMVSLLLDQSERMARIRPRSVKPLDFPHPRPAKVAGLRFFPRRRAGHRHLLIGATTAAPPCRRARWPLRQPPSPLGHRSMGRSMTTLSSSSRAPFRP